MSSGNGVIRIGKKGLRKFAFGDDDSAPIIEVDVVNVHDELVELDWKYRDAEGKLLPDKSREHRTARFEFVKGLILETMKVASLEKQHALKKVADDLTLAEALEFERYITEETARLKDFFAPATGNGQSPPGSSVGAVTYSE